MSNIVRWNPLREMAEMRSAMDRFFEDWRSLPLIDETFSTGLNRLAIDMHEDDQNYTISTELPGVKAENIDVRYEGDMLLIDAEVPEVNEERKQGRTLIRERRYGRYSRRVQLPTNIDREKVEATYTDGVLTLTLPKTEEAKPHLITVKAGNGSHTLQPKNEPKADKK